MSATPQPADLGILLALGYQEFVRELRAALAAQGFDDLGRSDGFVFRALGSRPMTVSELGIRLEITKQGAAQIIDDMSRRGYVERGTDPDDRRARLVSLSARGARALAAARRFHREYERRLAQTYGAAEVAVVRTVLAGMAGGANDALDPHVRALFL